MYTYLAVQVVVRPGHATTQYVRHGCRRHVTFARYVGLYIGCVTGCVGMMFTGVLGLGLCSEKERDRLGHGEGHTVCCGWVGRGKLVVGKLLV